MRVGSKSCCSTCSARSWTGGRACGSGFSASAGRTIYQADWAGVVDDWRAAYQPAMARVRQGERPYVTLDVLHRESLDALLPRYGVENVLDSDRRQMARAWRWLDPWPDTIAGLTRLKRKYRDRDAVQRWAGAAGGHGETRRAAVGRGPLRRPVPALQARCGGVSGRGRVAGASHRAR